MEKQHIRQLHPLELKVVLMLKDVPMFTSKDIVSRLDIVIGQANQAISWLEQKQIIEEVARILEVSYEVTELGKETRMQGLPVVRLLQLAQHKTVTLHEATQELQIPQKDLGSAFGMLSKRGNITLNEHKQIIVHNGEIPKEVSICEQLLNTQGSFEEKTLTAKERDVVHQYSKKRGAGSSLFRRIEHEKIQYQLTDIGRQCILWIQELGLSGDELGVVTQDMLKTSSWEGKGFRAYKLNMPPNRVSVGRRNSYADFLQQVKDKLVALGFEEFDGPLVETEFWNSDALFMPQFHVARDIHDVYYVKTPKYAKQIEEPWLSRVADAHEFGGETGSRGWNYTFDKQFTHRLILRSQGTVLSAKTLTKAKVPGKYFGILRVFRHDKVDATHLSDFYQTEGIIVGDDVNIKTLLGLLKMFAVEFAHAEEVQYVPGYFPFTEPSIEVHIKHPTLGWMELGGSGIFRPEVSESLGIDVPVAAWGIGIDRMATMQMQIDDIRELFSNDLEKVIFRKGVLV